MIDVYGMMQFLVDKTRTSLSALERSEQQIRRASSLEELLHITHSEDWKLWKCRLKLKSLANLDSRSASHRSTRFAAAFYDIDTLKVIDEEWQKTQCVPRETCVEVAKELGTTTNKFFKPPCVNVFRCGGCCNEESLSCMNTSTTYVSKTLFEISVPLTSVPEPVPIKIANHTGCKCVSNTQHHQYTIIRRSVQYPEEDGCPFTNKFCHNGWIWDSDRCECVIDTQHSNRREVVKTDVQPNPEHVQLPSQCVPGIVVVQRRKEVLMGPKAEKLPD
ncbi:Vascular endothelial growth factor D [Willisornis vidua]|uniref:Vascular endothelial growth factor D n=1 Tax=Willisornis vidua TaxID=1566151 RepID=A0ABQ9DA81_9PASS|nr:Vascular endothelial growth factor D [Willisornis vidua]